MIERAATGGPSINATRWLRALVCATALAVGCTASYPTAPTAVIPLALQVHVAQPLGEARVRNSYSFSAFVIRSDGAWQDVTAQTLWSSPDTRVFRSITSGRFFAESPGQAGVRAEYEGLREFIDIVVIDPARQVLPRLSVNDVGPRTVGASGQATVALLRTDGGSRDVTAAAAWTSSDPSVATVDRGRVVATGPGTTRITVTFEELTASYVFSVRPPEG